MPTQEATLSHEYEIALEYAPLVEEALDAKVGTLSPFDIFLIAGSIMNDPELWQAHMLVRKEVCDAHPEWPEATKQLVDCKYDLYLTAARRMTREEKLALRARIAAKHGLKW